MNGVTGRAVLPAGGGQFDLNNKQQRAVDIILYAIELTSSSPTVTTSRRRRGDALRLIMTGRAGTGKTVAIREMVRSTDRHRLLLLAPTWNAACAIGGQVR